MYFHVFPIKHGDVIPASYVIVYQRVTVNCNLNGRRKSLSSRKRVHILLCKREKKKKSSTSIKVPKGREKDI